MDDVVQTIISGMDNLLRQPTGCGEQTMIYLAPSVYVMSYWKQTNQITEQREKDGNTWIRGGATFINYERSVVHLLVSNVAKQGIQFS